ncbi:thioredoxin family protein [Calidifontibacillus erzurumensis]|uniref:Thioredoxin family protein n=1 Tax=Calidifontibacillus erzurumensis TaxID=2741433 RepID=A0A8J8GGA2_9BACI|nr:thioredoxin family protein [Calidifontibacillus erzurumensis]NSL52949.1 thioredoxin family protein [Calidifontibacillus erzurumensis]
MIELQPKQWTEFTKQHGVHYVYFYTPLCGTCQLATKMLKVVGEALDVNIFSCNLNFIPEKARQYEIESVPCLTIWRDGTIIEKIYAFHSVQHLYEIIKRYE